MRAFLTSGIINRMAPVGRKKVFDSNVFLFYKPGFKLPRLNSSRIATRPAAVDS